MSKWPKVALGEVLTQNKDYIDAPEPREYPKLSVKLYGKGVVLDSPADGSTLKMRKHQIAKPGQVILSEIWGKKGAIGFVPDEGDGALCTSHFFLFDADTDQITPKWLEYIFKGNYLEEQLNSEARGTTGYAAVRPKHLLAATIPLPPLSEQKKVVEWIDAVATRVEEAKELVRQTSQQIDDLSRSLLWASETETTPTRMSELVEKRPPDVEVKPTETYSFAGVYCFGRGVFAGQTKSGMDFKYPKLTRLRARNFTYPKLMAWEGAFGVVPDDCDGLVVSTEFPVFEINEDKLLPEVLDIYFKTPSIWSKVAGASTGTNVRRRRLNPKDFLKYEFPLPPRKTQEKIAEIRSRTEAPLAERQAAIDELDGLMKSVLNQVFNGAHL